MNRSIFYLQYTNPSAYPPLEHSGLILLNAGWNVQYFGIQSEGESNKLTFPETLADRVFLWNHQNPGFLQKMHYVAFTVAILARVIWRRPIYVYCSDLMSCPASWLISCLTSCKVVYHEHDSPDPEVPNQLSKFQLFLLWTRKRTGRSADLVIFPNEKRLEIFLKITGRRNKSLCVFNCPSLNCVTTAKDMISSAELLQLVFHGSINSDRLPLTLLEALSRFPGRVQLVVIGYETIGSKGYMTQFIREAKRLCLHNDVMFLGAMSHHEITKCSSTWKVGLAFMPLQGGDINMNNMVGASNKPFDYMSCGLALLVSTKPEWEAMYVKPGYGLSCNPFDVDSISDQLRWFLEHPAETREMGERGRQQILSVWNYETQFKPALDFLEETSARTCLQYAQRHL